MASPDAPVIFERKATGLVREAGWWDVLVYNVNFISIGLMDAFLFTVTIPFYPGVKVSLGLVGAGSVVALYLYVYTHFFSTLTGIFGFILSFIVGSISLFACMASEIIFLRDPFARLQHADGSYYGERIIYDVAIFLSGLVIYLVARYLNARRGIDVGKRLAEIPVE